LAQGGTVGCGTVLQDGRLWVYIPIFPCLDPSCRTRELSHLSL